MSSMISSGALVGLMVCAAILSAAPAVPNDTRMGTIMNVLNDTIMITCSVR